MPIERRVGAYSPLISPNHQRPTRDWQMPILSINMPKMGMRAEMLRKRARPKKRSPARGDFPMGPSSLADALFSKTQQRVFALLFGQPQRSFFATELIELTGSGSGAVQRELQRLVQSGLVTVTRIGIQKHYQANQEAPLFGELRSIVIKTVGLVGPIKAVLAKLAPQIRLALIYGSTAKGTDTASSDVDLLIISDDLRLEQVYAAIAPAERELARKINPTLYTVEEFQRRRQNEDSFLNKVLAGEHMVLAGSVNGVGAS